MINFIVMQAVKKYIGILIILLIFPISWFIGKNFITDGDAAIYSYIPQESDIVIEINSRNFIGEMMYQRIFNQDYVKERVEVEKEDIPTGINYFSKVILFREVWANESVWICVVGVENEQDFEKFVATKISEPHIVTNDGYAVIQLGPSSNQEQLDEHLANIANKKIKPFSTRVDLSKHFNKEKEINVYMIPQTSNANNQLIDGYLNMDFHQDHIDIGGEFNVVSGFNDKKGIVYPVNEEAALSIRSSLNVFNSIWWFNSEQIENVPQYDQLALDYDGMKIFLCDKNWGYQFPFKSFPEMQMRFDLSKSERWFAFFDTINAQGKIKVDTTTKSLITEQGTFLQYDITESHFDLSRSGVNLTADPQEDVYFDMQFKIAPLLDNTKFSVDEENPPSILEQSIGISIAEDMIDELHAFDNIEQIRFQMSNGGEGKIKAEGKVQMKDKNGQSMVESMFFMTEALLYIKEF